MEAGGCSSLTINVGLCDLESTVLLYASGCFVFIKQNSFVQIVCFQPKESLKIICCGVGEDSSVCKDSEIKTGI